ncbi:MAG: hypothetical protein IPJ98_17355 [Bryobacterales bacterium]|nr:hypothetical protein [Bryobacterales bacterium]
MSNYLGSARVSVVGALPAEILTLIRATASRSRTLERAKKAIILDELDAEIEQLISGPNLEPPLST